MSDIEEYEQRKQTHSTTPTSRLNDWLRNDQTLVATNDPKPWEIASYFILPVMAALLFFAAYRFRVRLITTIEEIIVRIGASAIRSVRALHAARIRIVGRMRDRADR